MQAVFTFGLWEGPWEDAPGPDIPTIARFESEHFDPGKFSPRDYYAPFLYFDDFDGLWAARVLMEFRPEHIEAAVAAAQYTLPEAAEYLTQTLLTWQRISARHWFLQVNPLEEFSVIRSSRRAGPAARIRICGVDLLLHHGLDEAEKVTRYHAHAFDHAGQPLGNPVHRAGRKDGHVCFDSLPVGNSHEGYTIVRLDTQRRGRDLGPVFVHVARAPGEGHHRIIGVHREHAGSVTRRSHRD